MCEFCETQNDENSDKQAALRRPRPLRAEPREDVEITQEDLSESGRDLLGLLRCSYHFGQASTFKPMHIKFVALLLKVPAAEQAAIQRLLKPIEYKKYTPTEDAIAEALFNILGQ